MPGKLSNKYFQEETWETVSVKCPFLKRLGRMIRQCKAVNKPFIPSPFELYEYCIRKEHNRCPLYRGFKQDADSKSFVR
jgi:hypothetical protein